VSLKNQTRPIARRDHLLIEYLHEETFVYDAEHHKAHCLNQTVSYVWNNLNGENTVADLAMLVEREFGVARGEPLVRVALKQLGKACLLEENGAAEENGALPSRREIARKVSMAGGAAFLLPAIASTIAPTPAMAGSWDGGRHRPPPPPPWWR